MTKQSLYGREIFRTGEYVKHFRPDDRRNPFSGIYKQKKQDTLSIINNCKRPATILDAGGGMGRLSVDMAQSGTNEIVLTDISIDMLDLASKNPDSPDNIKPVNADAHRLPFKDGSFDYVVGLDLLCHLKKPEKALREFHRVLKDNGLLIMDSTNSNPLWALFYPRYMGKNPLNWLRTIKLRGVAPGWEGIVKHYSRREFFSFLHDTHFEVKKILTYGPFICPKWHLTVSVKS